MRKTILGLATVAMLVLAVPGTAVAQDEDDHRGWRHKSHSGGRGEFADPDCLRDNFSLLPLFCLRYSIKKGED